MPHSANRPVVVLLAGGLSRRMGGGDKCLRPLAGRPLLQHVLERMEPQADTIVLNANGDAARFSAFALPVVTDPVAGHAGPLAGILSGMLWAREFRADAADIVSVPTDCPFLPSDLVDRLLMAREAAAVSSAYAASAGRTHPVVGLWPGQIGGRVADRSARRGPEKGRRLGRAPVLRRRTVLRRPDRSIL